MLRTLLKLLPVTTVYAHCDVPCGIYDPKGAQTAAETIIKMVEKIEGLPKENLSQDDQHALIRYTWTKEEHARICKHELSILWSDFFKEEHLRIFPDLHERFWKALKLCSYNKQHIDLAKAGELRDAVNYIADKFTEVKSAASK